MDEGKGKGDDRGRVRHEGEGGAGSTYGGWRATSSAMDLRRRCEDAGWWWWHDLMGEIAPQEGRSERRVRDWRRVA